MDMITVSKQPHVTLSLCVFVNTKPMKSSLEKRVWSGEFFTPEGKILELKFF